MTTTGSGAHDTGSPTTGTRATRVLGGLTLALLAAVAVLGLVITSQAEVFGQSVRLLYIHAPSAWVAYLAFGVTALASALYLWKRTRSPAWDRLGGAAAEIGVLFTGLCLLTGMVWGEITWGAWWVWDARLTTTALLFILFLGYLAVRRLDGPPETRARRAAIVGLIAAVDIPIVHQSVTWWRGLHQDATVLRRDFDPEIDGLMLFTLMLGFAAFTMAFVWLVIHRNRVAMLEDIVEGRQLEAAIAARHAEGVTR
jgi:heme exporter protein C